MTQRADGPVTTSCYEDMPFGLVVFRFLWPFWLFKDATRGDPYTRAAAYRHNRMMRMYLPGYIFKWVLGSAIAFSLLAAADSARDGAWGLFTLCAAAAAILFACSLCVLLVIGYVYMYLNRHDL